MGLYQGLLIPSSFMCDRPSSICESEFVSCLNLYLLATQHLSVPRIANVVINALGVFQVSGIYNASLSSLIMDSVQD